MFDLKSEVRNLKLKFLYLYNIERYTEIERENRILLEKMSHIMQNPKPNLYNPNEPKLKSLNRE